MIVAVDVSESPSKRDKLRIVTYALVGAEEHVLKSVIVGLANWAKHFRRIPSYEKQNYLRRFPERYRKILPYLSLSKVCLSIHCIFDILDKVRSELEFIIVDDRLARELKRLNVDMRLESQVLKVKKHLCVLKTLADNLANYARILLIEKGWVEAMKKIEELEKLPR